MYTGTMKKIFPKYEHRGYKYEPYEEVEYGDEGPENVKIWHIVSSPDGKKISFDWSPYSVPTFDDFKLWVELGTFDRFDLRSAGGPLDSEDLQKILSKMETFMESKYTARKLEAILKFENEGGLK